MASHPRLRSLYWWRRYCWTITSVAVGLTTLRVLIALPLTMTPAKMRLPHHLAIPGWVQTQSETIPRAATSTDRYNQTVEQRRYTFLRQDQTVTLTVITLSNTEGDVATWLDQTLNLSDQTLATLQPTVSGRGTYGLITEGNHYYLASCLHHDGHGTLTAAEYDRYAGYQFTQPLTLARWFIGQQPIPDRRCWGVMLETTATVDAPMPAPERLRQVWDNLPSLTAP